MNAGVTGGTAPFAYDWDNGAMDIQSPSVAPSQSTIYTVTVTDDNGCEQLDQAIVNVYAADATTDDSNTASICDGDAVLLGGDPVPGVPGVVYTWTAIAPATTAGLSCTDCPNPLATAPGTYTLELTIPVTGGATCSTTDDVVVSTIFPPAADFAGPDVTICKGETATLGLPTVAGYSYTWAPGNFLTRNNTAQTTFQPGSLALPDPNPFTYFLTAEMEGCVFVDEIEATVLCADAGVDGCGPRFVGTADATPFVGDTYSWSLISAPGNGMITGSASQPVTTVSATPGPADAIYELQVSANGVTCIDQVVVPPTCQCNVLIDVGAPSECPDFSANDGNVTLTATGVSDGSIAASSFVYTWSTSDGMGLSATSGASVMLTDDVARTVTVTVTSTDNPNFMCSNSIDVNNPAWSLPVFDGQDASGCDGDMVMIGDDPVMGYSYEWSLEPTSGATTSMPTVTIDGNATYFVTVTDDGSGCSVLDTMEVTTGSVMADAGPDIVVCDGSVVTIGGAI